MVPKKYRVKAIYFAYLLAGTEMGEDTLCYALGTSVMSKHSWDDVIHGRDCQDFQAFACQVKTHSLKAAGAATDKQISLRFKTVHSIFFQFPQNVNSFEECVISSIVKPNLKTKLVRVFIGTEAI